MTEVQKADAGEVRDWAADLAAMRGFIRWGRGVIATADLIPADRMPPAGAEARALMLSAVELWSRQAGLIEQILGPAPPAGAAVRRITAEMDVITNDAAALVSAFSSRRDVFDNLAKMAGETAGTA